MHWTISRWRTRTPLFSPIILPIVIGIAFHYIDVTAVELSAANRSKPRSVPDSLHWTAKCDWPTTDSRILDSGCTAISETFSYSGHFSFDDWV